MSRVCGGSAPCSCPTRPSSRRNVASATSKPSPGGRARPRGAASAQALPPGRAAPGFGEPPSGKLPPCCGCDAGADVADGGRTPGGARGPEPGAAGCPVAVVAAAAADVAVPFDALAAAARRALARSCRSPRCLPLPCSLLPCVAPSAAAPAAAAPLEAAPSAAAGCGWLLSRDGSALTRALQCSHVHLWHMTAHHVYLLVRLPSATVQQPTSGVCKPA